MFNKKITIIFSLLLIIQMSFTMVFATDHVSVNLEDELVIETENGPVVTAEVVNEEENTELINDDVYKIEENINLTQTVQC